MRASDPPSPESPSRRRFLSSLMIGAGCWLGPGSGFGRAADGEFLPEDDPLASLQLAWTGNIPWPRALNVTRQPGNDLAEKLSHAQAALAARGGGVVFFPPGDYHFSESIKIKNGIVLRGANPAPAARAQGAAYELRSRLIFPRYEHLAEGDGPSVARAFKGIYLEHPSEGADCGVVHLHVERGHIHFDEGDDHRCGSNRFVFGCVLRHCAVPDPAVPNLELGQKPWQRFTRRHFAAIDVKAQSNLLIANNRLPRSGEDDFSMDGFVLRGRRNEIVALDGVVFDYDNRPGIYANHFALGGPGGQGPDGTPETHPHAFRRGIVIRDNYVFNTGRMAIGFAGDGVHCLGNVIRFAKDVWRPTATGLKVTSGASTNDNRAVEMRGWRWVVRGNDYDVHRNWAADRAYLINDGEGLMHEDHVNATVRDSVLAGNRGNAYLSIYKTGGIDGLLVEGNDIRTTGGLAAIYANADRNRSRHPCRRVRIEDNTTAGSGILVSGSPGEDNLIRGNRFVGEGSGLIRNEAGAAVEKNVGFRMEA